MLQTLIACGVIACGAVATMHAGVVSWRDGLMRPLTVALTVAALILLGCWALWILGGVVG
jgi:hypothetical protein